MTIQAILGCGIWAGCFVGCQDPPAPKKADPYMDWVDRTRIELDVPARIKQFDPLVLGVTIANPEDKPVRVFLHQADLVLAVVRKTGQQAGRESFIEVPGRWGIGARSIPLVNGAPAGGAFRVLGRGDSIRYSMFLLEDPDSLAERPFMLFREKGRYEIRLQYRDTSGIRKETNTAEFVVEPLEGRERRAFDRLIQVDQPRDLYRKLRPSENVNHKEDVAQMMDPQTALGKKFAEDTKVLREFLRDFPDSRYAHVARFHLAHTLFYGAIGFERVEGFGGRRTSVRKVVHPKLLEEALDLLKDVARGEEEVLAPQALGMMVILETLEGEEELQKLGKESMAKLRERFGLTDYFIGEWAFKEFEPQEE
jgi:hypothetical protein